MTRFKLVPVEATEEQKRAGVEGFLGADTDVRDLIHSDEVAAAYRAMLQATPEPSPEMVDFLCVCMWPEHFLGQFTQAFDDYHVTRQQEIDRARMLSFLKRIGGQP